MQLKCHTEAESLQDMCDQQTIVITGRVVTHYLMTGSQSDFQSFDRHEFC